MSYHRNESFSPGKLLFAGLVIAVAVCAVLSQSGGLDWAINEVNTGKAGATFRGR